MVAVVIFITILTITIAAVGPSISTLMRREREEELLFRGKQYARGLSFRRDTGGIPTTEEMYTTAAHDPQAVEGPMCACDDGVDRGPAGFHPFLDERVDPSNRPFDVQGLVDPDARIGGRAGGTGRRTDRRGALEGPQGGAPRVEGPAFYDEWRFIVGDRKATCDEAFDPGSRRTRRAPS